MKVLVSDKLSEEGIKIFRNTEGFTVDVKTGLKPEELINIIGDYDALVIRSATTATAEVIKAGKKLKVIGRAGIGLDNVDIEAASKRGIVVMNTPQGNTITTAEHTISLLLSLCRHIPQADASMKNKKWEKNKFMGTEVFNKTLGMIGIGNIGRVVAKKAQGLDMNVIVYDPYISVEMVNKLGVKLVELSELYQTADFISVHTPLTKETKHLVDAKAFAQMKEGVRIINCARGGIIDEKALYDAVVSGKVAGAALDVFENEPPSPDSPLFTLDQVICTPHLGASTGEAQVNVAIAIAEQIVNYLKNGIVNNAVNMPSVDAETLVEIKPYLTLSEKLGSFLGQMVEGRMKEIEIIYSGGVIDLKVAPITISALNGILTPILKENVNLINAPIVAKERGIKVTETISSETEDFASLITLKLTTDRGGKLVSGALFHKKEPRIVRIDDFDIEAIPSGYMLVLTNQDMPGVIGNIGTILGNNNINIAGMQFGRKEAGGIAIAIVNVDAFVPDSVLEELKNAPNIKSIKLVKL